MKALISAYARSPFHFARKGALAATRPDELASQVIRGLINRTGLDPATFDDVIAGCAYPEGPQGNNIARIASLLAGLPHELSAMTINRFCGSSMSAIHVAAAHIEAGLGEAYLCLGVESMSMVPQGGLHVSLHPWLMENTDAYISMGNTAENVARLYGIGREAQDAFSLASHQKASAAQASGLLAAELVPIQVATGEFVSVDGCIRVGTSNEALAALKPVFSENGSVTAATSSPLTDGASVVLVTSEQYAVRHGLEPLARIRAMATSGVDPAFMGLGPIPASRKALQRARISVEELDVVELNEAFAAQALACIHDLNLRPNTINLDGGGIAIGHPLGATGGRITGKAAEILQRSGGRYALATQCIGGGQGISTVLEAL
jgi:acetyl-CoA acyltransferase